MLLDGSSTLICYNSCCSFLSQYLKGAVGVLSSFLPCGLNVTCFCNKVATQCCLTLCSIVGSTSLTSLLLVQGKDHGGCVFMTVWQF